MSKLNTGETLNRSGHVAYAMEEKERLVTAVLNTMFGEPKFYGSTDGDIVCLATRCAQADPEFLHKLTCYARNVGHLRSVSHVLTCVIAREAREYTRVTVRNVVRRPDDITRIMSCYRAMYGKPFPNAMKREIAVVIQKFDEYQLAKYNGGSKALNLRDVLRITHPVPVDAEKEALFGKILAGKLETPYTWETELSAKGNTKEVWESLLASGRMGYMALLRNLRNMVKSGADCTPALKLLADPEQVKRSRQLPFRFFSTYRALYEEELLTPAIHSALEAAITCSMENLEPLPGRTLLAVDVSFSMTAGISQKSTVSCGDIAALFAAMASRVCQDVTVCYFDSPGYLSCHPDQKGYAVKRYGKDASILEIAMGSRFLGGGTDMTLPMRYALEEDEDREVKPFDRVIYFSDNECNSDIWGMKKTVQALVDQYRRAYNKDLWVHGIDLQGYGTQQFCGERFNLIAGWSDAVLPFISLAEKDIATLVSAIMTGDTAL